MINEKRDRETRQLPYNSGIKWTQPTKKIQKILEKNGKIVSLDK
jgi:hypothetical protein